MKLKITALSCLAILSATHLAHASAGNTSLPEPSNRFWWPKTLDLSPLRAHDVASNPYGSNFDYASEFQSLDLAEVKKDIEKTLKTSQLWWPSDYGHYGPFMIRMAWHSAGTYRVGDGRGGAGGGQQRFAPLNSWPDNANLDKARRLMWPVKQKYGRKLSWADLMILSGNVALESMGFKTLGFAGGREDDWEPDHVYWGPENTFLDDKRRTKTGGLKGDLAAVQMGLIYVNPEGPGGNHDPLSAAQDMRLSFGRMAMNDEEIVALVAGGHTLGKAHGAHKPEHCVGAEPEAAAIEEQGLGWKNKCGKGNAEDTVTSGLEGAWTSTPTEWSMQYLDNLFKFEWVTEKSPAGATQWVPSDPFADNLVPDAHQKDVRHAPIMFTTDLALKRDPEFRKISERFLNNPNEFDHAFAKAWFKLTHRDMGPRARYVGAEVPSEEMLWQDPIPAPSYKLIQADDISDLKARILSSNLSDQAMIKAAWGAASSYRATDMRGGTDGGRLRLLPQKNWTVNDPAELEVVLSALEKVQSDFNETQQDGTQVSFADLVVLAGNTAIEHATHQSDPSMKLSLPFSPGRGDASQAQTDVASFSFLEPKADAFRNYFSKESFYPPLKAMVDKANTLNLTVPEMTVLLGGLRTLNVNTAGDQRGVLTSTPGVLSNDFFINLLDMSVEWKKSDIEGVYKGYDRETQVEKWSASSVDLIFGSNSELRSIAEVYASEDGRIKFIEDFIKAWTKVMNAGRFNLE
ncbi:catalase/peroxidase HPI [Marinomonas mediterranea]|uniref:catalase/peroxidase HPI n=1 Tax=Marinomonas mediterranea TaxID=119864 RepID=UPI00234BBE46|nr:catalase/peroxidase HPI [Marinomonas mediterranea]WCN11716.1 catalase/peroxidase HPI [Marinomonas mediterranea]